MTEFLGVKSAVELPFLRSMLFFIYLFLFHIDGSFQFESDVQVRASDNSRNPRTNYRDVIRDNSLRARRSIVARRKMRTRLKRAQILGLRRAPNLGDSRLESAGNLLTH